MITIIAAIGKNNELGKDNQLLWHLPCGFETFQKSHLRASHHNGQKNLRKHRKTSPKPHQYSGEQKRRLV